MRFLRILVVGRGELRFKRVVIVEGWGRGGVVVCEVEHGLKGERFVVCKK